jgi:antibiotic biosynthesis monooxygenase (ABM) superfamily enzyme
MSANAVLIATARVRAGDDAEFAAWKARHDTVIGKFPGFVSSDIMPPTNSDSNEWTIVLNFRSKEDLTVWQQSRERAEIIAAGVPLFEGGNFGEVAQIGEGGEEPGSNVTEVIFSRIKPGMEDTYREWTVRIQAAQAKYPGYRGMFLQPPDEKGGMWTTIIRFDTAAQLEAWMNASERKELLRESKAFIEHEQLTRLATSFPGWVPIDPMTGKGPPNWKTALLVLLGLFPVVMLEMRFLSPELTALGLHASLATFIGNAISVAITSFITMPLFVRWFGWWLFLEDESSTGATLKGVLILSALFALEVAAFWRLLPW